MVPDEDREQMNYFQVSFNRPGPYINFPADDDESLRLLRIISTYERAVERMLTRAGFDWVHSYSWPDGSCYKYVRGVFTQRELRSRIEQELLSLNRRHPRLSISLDQIYPADEDTPIQQRFTARRELQARQISPVQS